MIDGNKSPKGMQEYQLAFACDRKMCEKCSSKDGICYHTTDINHAVNFSSIGENKYCETERTCTIDDMVTGERADYNDTPEHIKHCNACHCEFGFVTYNEDGDVDMSQQPIFCPWCGAKVVSE